MTADRAAERKSARDGRKVLEETLAELGDHPAAVSIRVAERSLKQLDRGDSSEAQDYRHLRHAIDCLSDALAALQKADTPETLQATESVARTLALLNPLTKVLSRMRRRRE